MFEVQSASSLDAGLALIPQYVPELILVDLNLPDSSGYETFLHVRECAQGIPIVVLTGLDDDQVAVRAVEDGAQDYLVKNLIQPKQIARCVNMALSRQKRQGTPAKTPPSPNGTVLSLIGSKGGVGTSTTAVNLGALLAQNGLETVLIELQPGRPGTLSLYLQTDPAHGLNGLLKRPADTITPSDLQHCLVEALPGLHLLCPGASAGAWEALDAEHVRAILAAARRVCRFVILDLPARLDEGVAEALKLSDSITLLVDRESASIHCAPAVLEQIRTATSRNKEVRLAVIDRTGLELPVPLEDIKKQLKMHPLAMIPAAPAAIALSYAARTPMVLLYPEDSFSLAHFELAEHLIPEGAAGSIVPGRQLSRKISWSAIPETIYG
jgi:MinD-like ATPase involved in chromosome partitioning or flagellar assembly/CheY-like chemotaxis protein